nr:MAG TPA: portal protein [Caudoviricetes sp.]
MKNNKILTNPEQIFGEHKKGNAFKDSIGDHGITEQSKVNERFYVGDHWHGAKFGVDKPLMRRNLIKRIGDYKIACVTSNPIAVNYTADGIPIMAEDTQGRKDLRYSMLNGDAPTSNTADNDEISIVMEALSNYFNVTAERVKFDQIKWQALRNSYISGTGLIWCYWDELIDTGLYVDSGKQVPIKGDLSVETVDVEQVVFGDPNDDNVQRQPYIIIAQRLYVEQVKREAKRNGVKSEDIEQIKPDENDTHSVNSGDRGEKEPDDSKRVTVLTKLYKEWDDNGGYKVMCTRVCEKTVIRKPFDMKIKLYPLAKMSWEPRKGCIYGDSEITYMIPNQIAVNRALTAEVWAMMSAGMPVTIVNDNELKERYTNTPGKVIRSTVPIEYMDKVVHVVQPPSFVGQLISGINDIANNTLSDNGANDAALGNVRPDNASAIIQLREASMAPMQVYMNRFYAMIEDVARIWADFWLHLYGDRSIKINDKDGTHYFPFSAERYEKLVINARVDVGASTLWSEAVVISTLDNLLANQLITFEQYLERVPAGIIPDATRLLADIRQQNETAAEAQYESDQLSDDALLQQFAAQHPDLYKKFVQLPPEQKQAMLMQMRGSMQKVGNISEEQEAMV